MPHISSRSPETACHTRVLARASSPTPYLRILRHEAPRPIAFTTSPGSVAARGGGGVRGPTPRTGATLRGTKAYAGTAFGGLLEQVRFLCPTLGMVWAVERFVGWGFPPGELFIDFAIPPLCQAMHPRRHRRRHPRRHRRRHPRRHPRRHRRRHPRRHRLRRTLGRPSGLRSR